MRLLLYWQGTLVAGPWSLVPGLWSLVPGPWSLVPGPWSLVPGLWSLASGRWSLVAGHWSLGNRHPPRAKMPIRRSLRHAHHARFGSLAWAIRVAYYTGKYTWTWQPPPGASVMVSAPPWRLAMRAAMVRPMPKPGTCSQLCKRWSGCRTR